MDRPTKEQVERALAVVDDVASTSGDEHGKLEVSAILLAAEVRALSTDLFELRNAYALLHERIEAYDETHAELQRLKATIVRVKDQVAVWRAYSDLQDCVAEMEDALRVPCASSVPDASRISTPGGLQAEAVVPENPAKNAES